MALTSLSRSGRIAMRCQSAEYSALKSSNSFAMIDLHVSPKLIDAVARILFGLGCDDAQHLHNAIDLGENSEPAKGSDQGRENRAAGSSSHTGFDGLDDRHDHICQD